MHILLIADTFPPARNSAAVQLRDLAKEMVIQGHKLTVLIPSSDIPENFTETDEHGYKIIRLKTPRLKDQKFLIRALNELLMPFAMLFRLRLSRIKLSNIQGIIWYSPSIFHGPLVAFLNKRMKVKSYLIIRDIFPEWAVDLGLMKRGLAYFFFKLIANFQYSLADIIGVQSHSNLQYFSKYSWSKLKKIEVLENWLGNPEAKPCSIDLRKTIFFKRKIIVYTGNMGVAQGVDVFLQLAEFYKNDVSLGFLFVGRGSELESLKQIKRNSFLDNVMFFDEISPSEIIDLYSQCTIGLLALAPNHKLHNIPGKFISYMQNGLPCLAVVNDGNDLNKLIDKYQVGQVVDTRNFVKIVKAFQKLLEDCDKDAGISRRCLNMFNERYSASKAVKQITSNLDQHPGNSNAYY